MTINPDKWKEYRRLRSRGFTQAAAAKKVGVSLRSAERQEVGLQESWQNGKRVDVPLVAPPVLGYEGLSDEAKRAWHDFSYFQRRYLGRLATPWQAEAAELVLKKLASPDKEWVCVNAPPGCGKSTTFTCDIPLWMTVRNRAIRGQIGSASMSQARTYIDRIKRFLTMTVPYEPEAAMVQRGLAVNSEATIAGDFGTFHPDKTDRWAADAIVVQQHGERLLAEKEPTWSAFGMDSRFLGMRYDLIIWDDLVDNQSIRTVDAREKQQEWWDNIAEKRLDPSGVLILQGQRLGADDLYRYALDKPAYDEWEDDADDGEDDLEIRDETSKPGKYYHVIFKAHYDDRCKGRETHRRDAPYYPEGCLLDPRRLPWRELRTEMSNKRNNFAVLYQQEDIDPETVLVDPLWIAGGKDPRTGETFPGCWDERSTCELPGLLHGQLLSIATADPSPTKFWSIQWWVVRIENGQPQERYLMDLVRQNMDAPDFLDWSQPMGKFIGVMEEWQARSADLRLPITTWIVEANAAQRFMLQYEHVRRWLAQWRVQLIPHQTTRNKTDPEFGVQTLAGIYKYGLVRLPHKGKSFLSSAKLVEEVTHYPGWRTDDCVMAQWFLEWNLPKILPHGKGLPRQQRPSWLRSARPWKELVHAS